MTAKNYVSNPLNTGLYDLMLSQKHLWLMEGSIIRGNEPDCFAAIAHSSCFVFVGGRGYGKHTMISAFAGSACSENGYTYLEIPCADFFSETNAAFETIREFFEQLSSEFEDNQKLFVSFDGAEVFLKQPSMANRFMSCIKKLMTISEIHFIFALCCESDPSELLSVFYNGTHIITPPLPNDEKRADLLNDKLSQAAELCGLEIGDLVKCTDGFTYGELVRFSEELLMLMKGKYLDNNELVDFSDKNITVETDFLQPVFYETLCNDIKNITPDTKPHRDSNSYDLIETLIELIGSRGAFSGNVERIIEKTTLVEPGMSSMAASMSNPFQDNNEQQLKDSLDRAYDIEEAENMMLP